MPRVDSAAGAGAETAPGTDHTGGPPQPTHSREQASAETPPAGVYDDVPLPPFVAQWIQLGERQAAISRAGDADSICGSKPLTLHGCVSGGVARHTA